MNILSFFTSSEFEVKTENQMGKSVKKLEKRIINDGSHSKKNEKTTVKSIKRRRIKIRLRDPNNPDSYICEIYDSSFENEADKASPETVTKPKTYFDILMSKESRQNFNINSQLENDKIPDSTQINCNKDSEEIILKRKQVKMKNKQKLEEMRNRKMKNKIRGEKILKEVCNGGIPREEKDMDGSSSDEENLDQAQSKVASKRSSTVIEPASNNSYVNGDGRKNILSYFTKSNRNASTPNTKLAVKKNIRKSKSESRKLSEVNIFKDNIETNKTKTKNIELKRKKKSDVKESSKKCETTKADNKKRSDKDEKKGKTDETRQKKEEIVVIDSDEEIFTPDCKKIIVAKNTSPVKECFVKLAPLFLPRKKVDVVKSKAKMDFLHSGLPQSVKKAVNLKKAAEEQNILTFPSISHVQQRDNNPFWKLRKIMIPLKKDSVYTFTSKKKMIELEKQLENVSPPLFISHSEPVQLNEMEDKYPTIKVKEMYESCKEKHDKYSETVVEKRKKRKRSKRKKEIEILEEGSVSKPVWTEKYKPRSSADVLGNYKVVSKLKRWLESWKDYDDESKSGNRKSKSNESSEEFLSSDDEILRTPVNTCLLEGEIGCGKTCLIYSLANELSFNVLEINASSKRTGKKILSDLQEATQSHKVHHDASSQNLKNFLDKRKAEVAVEQNNCLISLILIEDADIVFNEHDEGFVSALATLVSSSKRPVIMISNDIHCPHLERFKTHQYMTVRMFRPSIIYTSCFLNIVSQLEGVKPMSKIIETLVFVNTGDVRKSLLQLQHYILSMNHNQVQQVKKVQVARYDIPAPVDMDLIWWNCNKILHNKTICHDSKRLPSKRKRVSSLDDSLYDCELTDEEVENIKKVKVDTCLERQELEDNVYLFDTPPDSQNNAAPTFTNVVKYLKVYDDLSILDLLNHSRMSKTNVKDGVSLVENMEECVDIRNSDMVNEISKYIIDSSLDLFVKSKKTDKYHPSYTSMLPTCGEVRWRKQQDSIAEEMSALCPAVQSHDKSYYMDYLPILRNICRIEDTRFQCNTKRKNRFLHYFKSLGVGLSELSLKLNYDVLLDKR